MPKSAINDRLTLLRQQLRHHDVDAVIFPSADAHQSEYVAEYWQSRSWFSGFSGSAGTLVVGADFATLWTDSRYWLQATEELNGTGIELGKADPRSGIPFLEEFKRQNVSTVAMDGRQFSVAQVQQLERNGLRVLPNLDLAGAVWTDRPPLPKTPIYRFSSDYAGRTFAEKAHALRDFLTERQADYYLVSALDDIAWLFNLRGSDVDCNPVFYAFALVGLNSCTLYIDADKIQHQEVQHFLLQNKIAVKNYHALEHDLAQMTDTIAVDKSDLNARLHSSLEDGKWVFTKNPIRLAKAQKNETEMRHWRACMIADGHALVKAFLWLENNVDNGVTESAFAKKIAECRAENPLYVGESFNAIVGYEANGAIVHYRPLSGNDATIRPQGILLVDCGGQYLNGTTDITRTIALGTPTTEQKRNFTRVLQGHIALDRIHFPQGTNGRQLDMLARQPLYRAEQNFGHGTGHGVGFFLNVHEGPMSISSGNSPSTALPFKPGFVMSNEPGFYADGAYGIRIENLIHCIPGNREGWLQFETLTLFPIDSKLIDWDMLTASERDWLAAYHQKVKTLLSPGLSGKLSAWLNEKCSVFC